MSKAEQAVSAAREFAASIDATNAALGNARIHILRLADSLEAALPEVPDDAVIEAIAEAIYDNERESIEGGREWPT